MISGIILLIVGVLSFVASAKFIAANEWVNHTHEVIGGFQKILLSTVDATVGERGYIITGDEKFLQPYSAAKEEVQTHFNSVRALTGDNPNQQLRLDTLQQLVAGLMTFYESCIDLRKLNKADEAIALFETGQGVRIENTIRVLVRNAQREEETLLAQRMKQSQDDAADFKLISILLIAIILAIIAGIYFVIANRTKVFRKSEESFNKTINDYKFALDESNIVAVTDQKGIIIHVNDNFCRISKYSAEELIGQDHRIINSGHHSKEVIRDLWVTIANGRIWKGELKNKAKDGTIYWVDTTIVPFLDEKGKPYQYLAIRSDITQRKKAEEEILESKRKLDEEAATLKELNEVGNHLWRIDNLKDGLQEILSYSTRIFGARMGNVQIYSYEKKALVIAASKGFAKEFLDYFHEVSAGEGTACTNALKNRRQVIVEDVDRDEGLVPHLHIMHNAGVRSIQSTPLFGKEGTPIGMISTHLESAGPFDPFKVRIMELYALKAETFLNRLIVSEELKELNQTLEVKVTQRTLELTQSLERERTLNEMKSRFVSMASHEFRTPLSAINSSVALIEAYHSDEQKDKREKHIARIKSSVKNLVEIINDFLSLDRLEQNKIEVLKERFDLNDFSRDTIEEVNSMLKLGQHIDYTYKGQNEVVQDKKILRNILLNLLSNAIKYSEENKEIVFGIDVDSGSISIKVKDNGIGIPEEDQKHLFSKFYRAANVTDIQGTGLGLNIVQKYVELLGGKIGFESKLHQGTTFTVDCPYDKPDTSTLKQVRQPA